MSRPEPTLPGNWRELANILSACLPAGAVGPMLAELYEARRREEVRLGKIIADFDPLSGPQVMATVEFPSKQAWSQFVRIQPSAKDRAIPPKMCVAVKDVMDVFRTGPAWALLAGPDRREVKDGDEVVLEPLDGREGGFQCPRFYAVPPQPQKG